MVRPRKAPRLWLRPGSADRAATWLILDQGKQYATGAHENEEAKARELLDRYMVDLYRPAAEQTRIGRLDRNVGLVYFVSTNDVPSFPIKIGWAKSSADVRLAGLQTACPYLLLILALERGSQGTEARLHARFSHHRMRGEWFQRGPDLMAYVATLRASGNECATNQPRIHRMFSDRSREKGDVNV